MTKLNINGLISAPFTPMDDHGEIKLDVIANYANRLKRDHVLGVFICGTTGEGLLLSEEERKAVAVEWMKYKSPNFKIIVHVGSPSYKTAVNLAKHARDIGADAIGAMGPNFLPPNHVEALIDYCLPIANAASQLPFYYYHVPSISGTTVPMKPFLENAKTEIPNLAGVKFTHNNLMEMQQCMVVHNRELEILHGYDEVLLGGLALGVKGAVGSTYNYMASCYHAIIKNFNEGNIKEAQIQQLYAVKVVELLIKYGGGVRAGKAIMDLSGINCGPCRAPITSMSNQEKANLKQDLEAIDFFK